MAAPPAADQRALREEIAVLERRLHDTRAQLHNHAPPQHASDGLPALHALLLLADSALPLGSFAFSSGLESYLAHHKPSPPSASLLPAFHAFLGLTLATLASTALPYVLAAHRHPANLDALDNDLDASTPCTVARRASIAQGRALLALWQRSFKPHYHHGVTDSGAAIDALAAFSSALHTSEQHCNAHLAPLWGLVARVLAISLHDAAYLFLFAHARTVISAAVRASVMGPYQAQAVLASAELQDRVRGLVGEAWHVAVEDAGQSVPVMDLWVGRHEKLYSRIFNS